MKSSLTPYVYPSAASAAKYLCTVAEYIEARKRTDVALTALLYETLRRQIQEIAWGSRDFDSIRAEVLRNISEMENNRFFNFAKELQATWDQYTTPKKPKPIVTAPKPAKKGQGTCFAVSPEGHIMTANHVVDGANSYTVRFVGDSTKYDAKLINSAKASDLALLQIDQPTPNWLAFKSMKKVNVGTPIFTMGFPAASLQGTEPKFTDGTVSSKSGIKGDSTFFQMSIPIQPGNSGGPVLTNDGEVVGVVTSTAAVEFYYKNIGTMPQNVNWAVKSDYAMLLVDQPDKKNKIPNREKAISISNKAICFIEVTTK